MSLSRAEAALSAPKQRASDRFSLPVTGFLCRGQTNDGKNIGGDLNRLCIAPSIVGLKAWAAAAPPLIFENGHVSVHMWGQRPAFQGPCGAETSWVA